MCRVEAEGVSERVGVGGVEVLCGVHVRWEGRNPEFAVDTVHILAEVVVEKSTSVL